jgi:hypothetical protein
MSCESFERLLAEIGEHLVFNNSDRKRERRQAPVTHQLRVFLKFIGTEGTGGSNTKQQPVFHIGYGTADM